MKRYIKPEIKAQRIELENCVLAGSTDVPISEDPATGPALSQGNIFGDDDGTIKSLFIGARSITGARPDDFKKNMLSGG